MNKRLTILLLVLLATAGSLVWNRAVYGKLLLKEPLAMPVIHQIFNDSEQSFHLFYLENANGQGKRVTHLQLRVPGQEPLYPYAQPTVYSNFGHYRLKQAFIVLDEGRAAAIRRGGQPITEAEFFFSDGTSAVRSIGQITPVPDATGALPLVHTQSGYSGNSGHAMYKANEALRIDGMDYGNADTGESWLDLTVSVGSNPEHTPAGEIAFPLEVRKGDMVTVNYTFAFPKVDRRLGEFNKMLRQPQFVGVTSGGESFRIGAMVFFTPNPTEDEVKRLVRQEVRSR